MLRFIRPLHCTSFVLLQWMVVLEYRIYCILKRALENGFLNLNRLWAAVILAAVTSLLSWNGLKLIRQLLLLFKADRLVFIFIYVSMIYIYELLLQLLSKTVVNLNLKLKLHTVGEKNIILNVILGVIMGNFDLSSRKYIREKGIISGNS